MKSILEYIEHKKARFSQLPFFEYLRDPNIDPLQKLSFIPCASPFVMSFRELNKNVFRDEHSTDELQIIINYHAQQDESHWIWFLEDIEKLGFNPVLDFRSTLKRLWNNDTACSRHLVHEIYRATYQRSPLDKLVVIETIEATGNVFLVVSSKFIQALEKVTQEKYRYFGAHHLNVETGHTYCSEAAHQYIESIELTDADRHEQMQVVDRIFDAFSQFTDGMLAYIQKYPMNELIGSKTPLIGTCLLEAGLITLEQLDIALAEQKTRQIRLGEILSSHGWVKQQTIEYLMNQFASSSRDNISNREKSMALLN